MSTAPASPRPQAGGVVRPLDELPGMGVAVGALMVSGTAAGRGVSAAEERAFVAVNRLPSWLEPVLWVPMQLGSLWGPFVVGGLAWRRWRSWRPTVGAVATGVLAWQLAKVAKRVVARGRPLDELEVVIRRVGTPEEGLGFVSGHSTVAFSLASVMSPYLGRPGRLGAYALASVVSLARVHVSAHLPLDAVGGAALGTVLGHGWNLAVGVTVADDGLGTLRPGR